VNIELKELELDWPPEISVYELKSYILSQLINHGEPLRWAITSLTNNSGKAIQKISIEAVLIINEDKKKNINTDCN
tara:strand:- start:186 stop:413 length:228 start_codon:yes stop_codon:yes gene_type:complete